MMALTLILLIAACLIVVCVWMLSSTVRYERAMHKLEAQRRAEYYAQKYELSGLPLYDQHGWLAQKASTKSHAEKERNEREAFRRHCAAHIFGLTRRS